MNFDLFKTNLLQGVQANDNSLVLTLLSKHSSYAHRWKDLITKNGDTVVHLAAHSGCVSIIKYYAELGNKVILEHKNLDGKTPLHIAAHSSQLECVKYLLSYGVSVNALKRSDWTPLMLACTKTNLDIIKELLVHDAELNMANKDGWTAFHIASREGDVNIIQYLLEVNLLVWNTKSKNGRTPLHTACLHGHLEVVKIFLESASYDINVKDSCGITPVMDAVSGIHNQVVEFLVEKGASITEQDKLGRNVLHLAAEAGNVNCIQYLVNCDYIAIDSQTPQGRSPLHFACKENEFETFCVLLELGANCYLKDNRGRTAMEYVTNDEVRTAIWNKLKQ
ncbi:Ankyrin repeat domain-containing protein 16 [Araneus ventricosus]|uniref:Ankyrin repeat domain-containing protein 16 n=1 Tax=Araneus ventricosus TaxID=182803 RepID=A0A4Y2MV78_ARAVE|nr:Ankyrin repeat domain-containing protein 16 [Araneus ventricosus]